MKYVVAHPETQHSYHSALGLLEAGLLDLYMTGLSLQRQRWLVSVLERTKPKALRKLRQHRQHDGIPRGLIRTWPAAALSPGLSDRGQFRLQAMFSDRVGRTAARRRSGVFAFNANALQAFRRVKARGLPAILDQSIAHRRFSVREGALEAAAFPEWGETWTAPTWRVEAEDEELSLADLIVCGSRFCADTLVEFGIDNRRIVVVPYGANTSRFAPSTPRSPSSAVRLLFVGAISLRKGVQYLLEAVRRIGGSRLQVTLVGHMGIDPSVLAPYAAFATVRPFVLHEEVPQLFRDHDLYVFPSLVEGSSISTYESLASGLPVITTPNSGSIVENGRSGIIIPPRDIEALMAAIDRLASDRAERSAMGAAARERAVTEGDWSHYRHRLAAAIGAAGAVS